MVWDAYIDRVEKEEKGITVIVTFTNNVDQKFQQDFHFYSGTKDTVFAVIEDRLNGLNTVASLPTDIPLGLFVPPTPKGPTPEEQAKIDYARDLKTLNSMYRAIALAIITKAYLPYIAMQEDLMQRFQPDYIDLF